MWITLTPDAVATRLAAEELTALKEAAISESQDGETILAEAIAKISNKVRAYVPGTRGEAPTIPDELETAALALIRDYLFNRLPGMEMLNTEGRREETKRAHAELSDCASGRLKVVAPVTEAAAQAQGPSVTSVTTNTRKATRQTLKGIF